VIVYGDPSYDIGLDAFAAQLRRRAVAVADTDHGGSGMLERLSAARGLLIDVGRLEQAGQDHLEGLDRAARDLDRAGAASLRAATDAAAEAFCAVWEVARGRSPTSCEGVVASALADLVAALDRLPGALADVAVTVKTPEGFAFYTLYPEQYCVAAHEWADDHRWATDRQVAVIGLRSIGTTQSAVVARTLVQRGWEVRRLTVRPVGPAFARTVGLPDGHRAAAWSIVVDEGPGLSGSSMAAAAEALERAGTAADHISFLPGHGGDPGPAASGGVRTRWAATSRYVAPLASMRWLGMTLPEVLSASTPVVCRTPSDVAELDDLGGGAWRAFTYRHEREWPAVDPAFERAKYRCTLADGRAVLWKFFGADDERAHHLAEVRYGLGWGPRPLGRLHGFVATEWIRGTPLDGSDPERYVADVARYVHDVAGPALAARQRSDGVARLAEMLYWNTSESLGPATADRTRAPSSAAERESRVIRSARFGDGSMQPHGWLLDGDTGRLRKVGGLGHDRDHTMVGAQSIAWDVAGTIVEWRLVGRVRRDFLRAVAAAHPEVLSPTWMRFHELAYAAFRVGQATMSAAASPSGDADAHRSRDAVIPYRQRLAALIHPDRAAAG
jgi:hypothetical protein